MTSARELLEQATPLPWRWVRDSGATMLWGANGDPGGVGHVLTPHVCPHCDGRGARCLNFSEADEALVMHAVNRLPDYEATVDALERLAAAVERLDPVEKTMAWQEARAALVRLREGEAAHVR